MVRSVLVARGEHGGLRVSPVGSVPGEGVLSQVLPVAGGLLEMNIGAPDQGLSALISDVGESAWWVPFVYGDAVLEALLELDEDVDETTAGNTVVLAPRDEELADTAVRLLYGFWLRRWAPPGAYGAPIEEWLVDAELGALAARAEALFGSDEVAVALLRGQQTRLADALGEIVRSTDASSLPATFARPAVAVAVQRAAFAAADLLEPDAPGGAALVRAVDAARAALRSSSGPASPALPAADVSLPPVDGAGSAAARQSLEELRERVQGLHRRDFAIAAGAHSGPTSGSAPADWTAVHPRQLDAGDLAVRWDVDFTAGEPVVVITAAAPADEVTIPVEPGELYARVDVDGELNAAAFTYDPADEVFVARCPVTSGIGALVSVYSDVYSGGGRLAPAEDDVRAVRAAVIAVTSARARDIHDGSAYIPPFAFERLAVEPRPLDATERAVRTAVDEIDLEWLVLSESTSTLRGGSAAIAAASFTGRDPRLAVRATVAKLRGTWRVRLVSLGFDGPLAVTIRYASGVESEHAVELGADGDALIEVPVTPDDVPVAMLLTATDR